MEDCGLGNIPQQTMKNIGQREYNLFAMQIITLLQILGMNCNPMTIDCTPLLIRCLMVQSQLPAVLRPVTVHLISALQVLL